MDHVVNFEEILFASIYNIYDIDIHGARPFGVEKRRKYGKKNCTFIYSKNENDPFILCIYVYG